MSPALKRSLWILFDVACVVAICALRSRVWPKGVDIPDLPGTEALPEGWWRLGGPPDLLLHGPDAGDWAAQARAVAEGGVLDNRRLPLYPHLTAAMSRAFPDIVFAGHLVNHLVSMAAACLTYALGRLTSGRGAAVAAGVMMAVSPALAVDQRLFAVDPTFQLVAVLVLITGWLATSGPRWGPAAAGIAVGLAMSTHYIGMLLPFLLLPMLVLRDDRWWFPPAAMGMAGVTGAATFWYFIHDYPPITWKVISVEYTVGVLSSVDRSDLLGHGLDRALPLVLEKLPVAVHAFYADVSTILTPSGQLAGAPIFALFLIGLVGLGLPPGPEPMYRRWQWRGTLWLGLFLIPMLGLEASDAPDRYEHYAWPVVLLCIGRGVASLASGVDEVAGRLLRPWPLGGASLVAGITFAAAITPPCLHIIRMRPNISPGMHERRVGALVAHEFPGRGPIVTWSQEIRFYASRDGCKGFVCGGIGMAPGLTCPENLSLECGGQGDLPYIIDVRDRHGFADQPDELMDAWVKDVGEVVGTVDEEGRRSVVYRIREERLPKVWRPKVDPAAPKLPPLPDGRPLGPGPHPPKPPTAP